MRFAGTQRLISNDGATRFLFVRKPVCPSVPPEDRRYQAMEYEALLFALLSISRPESALVWAYGTSGWSDTPVSASEFEAHPLFGADLARRICASGNGETAIVGNTCVHRGQDGSVRRLAQIQRGQICVEASAHAEESGRRVTPIVGRLPEWALACEELMERFITEVFDGSSAAAPLPHLTVPIDPPLEAESLTIVAHAGDETASHVFHRARGRQIRTSFVDLTYAYDSSCTEERFGELLSLLATAPLVYARPIPSTRGEPSDAENRRDRHALLLRVLGRRSAQTLNRPSAGYTNLSKAAHIVHLSASGLSIPPTLVTNDADAVELFAEEHGRVVYKSTSVARSVVQEFTSTDTARVERIEFAPVLFQRFLDGANARVHTVAREVCGLEITTPAVDYRFATGGRSVRALALPHELQHALTDVARQSGLSLSGVDLRWDRRASRWMVLEMNRMPALETFDHMATSEVADRICALASSAGR